MFKLIGKKKICPGKTQELQIAWSLDTHKVNITIFFDICLHLYLSYLCLVDVWLILDSVN